MFLHHVIIYGTSIFLRHKSVQCRPHKRAERSSLMRFGGKVKIAFYSCKTKNDERTNEEGEELDVCSSTPPPPSTPLFIHSLRSSYHHQVV